jgi:hypothetical protein
LTGRNYERGKKKRREKFVQGTLVEVGLVLEDRMIAVHHSQLYRSYYAPLFSSELSAREGDLVFFALVLFFARPSFLCSYRDKIDTAGILLAIYLIPVTA